MIDTVILTIPKSKFRNLDGSAKLNFEAQQQDSKKGYAKWVKNPTKEMLESGKYYPRLTGYKRFTEYSVKIEFSAPKLIFGNNLEELQDSDFNKIIDTLYDRLLDMEIKVSKLDLAEARVSAIHYSKNIELQNNYTARYVISELAKTNKRKSFDNTDFRYSNDGQSLQMYSKAHSFVIYDKMADLQKAERRAIDKDCNKFQRSLFDELPKEKEIVRFEARLSDYRKMKKVLGDLEFTEETKFNRVFSEKLSQKVLNYYWKKVYEQSKICFLPLTEPKEILEQICIKISKVKPFKKLQFVAMCLLAKDEKGLTELRSILYKNNTDRSWYRLVKEFQILSKNLQSKNPRDWIKQVEGGLLNYKKLEINKTKYDSSKK